MVNSATNAKTANVNSLKNNPRKKHKTQTLAILLYVNGLSFCAIAKLVGVSHKAVYDWV
ncbi:MAG: hypothetical protein LBC12_06270, partial [Nitrososphaerota archaeon]|nr:hypothetical protein [Nitrososphaerota archaeon]